MRYLEIVADYWKEFFIC